MVPVIRDGRTDVIPFQRHLYYLVTLRSQGASAILDVCVVGINVLFVPKTPLLSPHAQPKLPNRVVFCQICLPNRG